MSERTDPLSAAARHIEGGGPVAGFLAALSESRLFELASLCMSEAAARAEARRATLCDHPPTPACDSCGGQHDGYDGVSHLATCAANIAKARELTYHPSAGVRRWVERILDAARAAGAL